MRSICVAEYRGLKVLPTSDHSCQFKTSWRQDPVRTKTALVCTAKFIITLPSFWYDWNIFEKVVKLQFIPKIISPIALRNSKCSRVKRSDSLNVSSYVTEISMQGATPAGTWQWNNVILALMWHHYIASMSLCHVPAWKCGWWARKAQKEGHCQWVMLLVVWNNIS